MTRIMLAASSAAAALLGAGAAYGQSGEAASLEELVVTAQRREETLREAPVAVSAFSGEAIQAQGMTNLSDLRSMIPSVQIGESYTESRVAIRGVGSQSTLLGASPAVAYHVNGVYLERTGVAGAAFFDVERIEVLRGPQGTLFGRNATGGSINVVTKRATPEFGGYAGVTLGAEPFHYGLDAVVNGALDAAGVVSGRIGVQRLYSNGYTKNLENGGRLDDADSVAVRGQLRFAPGGAFEAGLTGEYQRQNTAGPAQWLLGGPNFALTPAELMGGTRPDKSRRAVFANQGFNDKTFKGLTLDANLETDLGAFEFLAAAHGTDISLRVDGDGTRALFTLSDFNQKAEQYFSELIFRPDLGETLDVLVGVNAFYEKAEQLIEVRTPPLNRITIIDAEVQTYSYAAFAHGTWEVSDAWDVFGGIRYTFDRKAIDEANNFLGVGTNRSNWDAVTYQIGTSYDLSRDISAYATYATGFKAGGFQAGSFTRAFNPETNKNLEAGLKGYYLDRRLELNIAAFRSSYEDLQVNQIRGVAAFIDNAAEATIKGVELEARAQLPYGFRAEAVVSLLDAKFKEYATIDSARPALGELDLSGNRLPKAPKATATFALSHVTELDAGRLTVGARYNWQDDVFFSEFNLPVVSQNAVGRWDLTAEFRSADRLWTVGAYALNLTDEVVINNVNVVAASLGSAAMSNLDPGRKVGLFVRRDF
ncbi:TonB-dependent receptor [Phenylobacterium sp. SCN 70-31]|uniref:TonB-dependent receptor n=1 Tax=Phenylobacterium sp. SCN 70-31 TaxID=1660129 RepID=UPI00086CF57C|nr:TonB-dependent receptor [Phenylobacterium sp. SCN 70-31]ODT87784.1 MAG: hypothetical protein ABS78_10500 [Phenylobacterium sp. SCN 70-31]